MTGLLVSRTFSSRYATALERASGELPLDLETFVLEDERGTVLAPDLREKVDIAFLSGDLYPGNFRGFFESLTAAPNLKWVHVFYVGIEGPLFVPLLERGVCLTNSAGASAQSIAQTAIAGVLMLSRPFLHWANAQRERAWRPVGPGGAGTAPRDLRDETMTIIGLGAIGSNVARLAKALDMKVIGVRRSAGEGDHVDEMVPPSKLDSYLPKTDWLVLACPLTDETRGLIDERRLSLLPAGARIVNVARGAVIDEAAMIRELQSGHLGGAYLDVFATEPLPPASPLWDMPNVILTPHNSSASRGNYERQAELFFENLKRWGKNEPLLNQVKSLGQSPDQG